MSLSNDFEDYCNNIQLEPDEREKWETRINKITKKLNKQYYNSNASQEHMILVGSIGRGTAIHGSSDWDCIFSLPMEVYSRFNNYKENGQSALLQEIKEEIKSLYPKIDIKGDGQVVVISFDDGEIELVPGFEQFDGSYKYPDSHEGGSWKITNPIPEQDAVLNMKGESDNNYIYMCQLLRKWKNNIGFKFKGLLIDTLVKKFIDADNNQLSAKFNDYERLLIDLFEFLSKEDVNQSYWLALGSNQQISNDDNGQFIRKAKKSYNKLKDLDTEDKLVEAYRDLFGKDFAKDTVVAQVYAIYEEFVEHKFNIDIRYNLELECRITQNGFRPKLLTEFLSKKWSLKANKELSFEVSRHDIPQKLIHSIVWYWKVRNIGNEARKRNMERGEIVSDKFKHIEHTNFSGNHYVECYAVLGNTVVSRGRITVPIDTINGID